MRPNRIDYGLDPWPPALQILGIAGPSVVTSLVVESGAGTTKSVMRLFDAIERTDGRPAKHTEDSFSFLNRAAGPVWERIRSELDSWYAAIPDPGGDLRRRFQRRESAQHFGAWWELYLHRLFSRLGFQADPHVDLPNGTNIDFRLERGGRVLYVEATTCFSGIDTAAEGRHGGREADVLEAIELVDNPSFLLSVAFDRVGDSTPSLREIKSDIVVWLAQLDPDEVLADNHSGHAELEKHLCVDGWEIALEAIPLQPENRNAPNHRMIGMGPVLAGTVNDVERLTNSLNRKRGRYGELDGPLLIAVLSLSTFMRDHDVERVLYGGYSYMERGSRKARPKIREAAGFWQRSDSVAGVLLGVQIHPHTCAKTWPRLWHNPSATTPCDRDLPLPAARRATSGSTLEDPAGAPADVLGLARDWPGPEPPFARG